MNIFKAATRLSRPSSLFTHSLSIKPFRQNTLVFVRLLSDSLRENIDSIVKSKDVTLFMKGTPEEPQCGFSRAVVQIFRIQGLDFSKLRTVDILQDQNLRDGLKEYSSWLTFPQVYVKGEFVGGCDIMLNMHQSGELEELLVKEKLVANQPEATVGETKTEHQKAG
ncbi:9073_t:CDS:2 [Paraglomus brasilianum]|uniref:Monothiol glutaredoxin-5, mitochondrial n=1 Tax=Paraglomus brasilianum TaxID=144538 RepID=A0A9N8VV27_9GLOM|nr:9073_t:CDS:2 [Paraglomus brasilianum]